MIGFGLGNFAKSTAFNADSFLFVEDDVVDLVSENDLPLLASIDFTGSALLLTRLFLRMCMLYFTGLGVCSPQSLTRRSNAASGIRPILSGA